MMQLNNAPWLSEPNLQTLLTAVKAMGEDMRFVGGCVRDTILGRKFEDFDLATTLRPEQVMQLASQLGFGSKPLGIEHGTVLVIIEGKGYEVTTLRRDVKTNGRHAIVEFTRDWAQDAARRDFTMNALSCDEDGFVHDYFGGVDDAVTGRIRFIGDAQARITEDVLRILRFFRFSAHYAHTTTPMDVEGLQACASLVHLLDTLSMERVRNELLKTLKADNPVLVWQEMSRIGVWRVLGLPLEHIEALGRLMMHEQAAQVEACSLRRLWAVSGGRISAQTLAEKLKLSGAEAARLKAMESHQQAQTRLDVSSDQALERTAYRVGGVALLDLLLLGPEGATPEQAAYLQRYVPKRFTLKGQDLLELGIAPGAHLGVALSAAENWWVEGNFTASKAACLAYCLEQIKR